MKPRLVLSLAAVLSGTAAAHDYPTVDRVEFVLECMRNNGGEHHHLYKCACAIDAIAAELPYETYVDGATVARYQGMGGERAGVFRDPEGMKELARRYRDVQAAAFRQCGIERKP
jgi:hypothetical protein